MTDLPSLDLILGGLAVYRASYLLVVEEGPFKIFLRLSELTQGTIIGDILTCFYCTSIWLSIAIASAFINPIAHPLNWLILVLAQSGIAIALYAGIHDRVLTPETPEPIATEDEEYNDVINEARKAPHLPLNWFILALALTEKLVTEGEDDGDRSD